MAVDSTSPSDRFAFKLLAELRRGKESSNVFFSPFSVMLCLLMVWEGASGATREAMGRVLEIATGDLEPAQSELRVTKLRQLLASALAIRDRGIELAVANSLWCSDQFALRAAYRNEVEKHYAAEIFSVAMSSRETLARINGWVAEKTRGKIGSILPSLDSLTRLVALNAIYFKGPWRTPFETPLTRTKPFLADGHRTIHVPLMHQEDEYSYCEQPAFQAVRLPYQTWRPLAMYVFLPAKDSSLSALLGDMGPAQWGRWLAALEMRNGTIELPRWKFEFGAELSEILRSLGMGEAFDPQRARFDGIAPAPPPLFLANVIHRALVEVTEEGTEAAAATTALVLGATLPMVQKPPKPPFVMIVDRLFFFAIRDDHSHALLFAGAVNNPE